MALRNCFAILSVTSNNKAGEAAWRTDYAYLAGKQGAARAPSLPKANSSHKFKRLGGSGYDLVNRLGRLFCDPHLQCSRQWPSEFSLDLLKARHNARSDNALQ